DRRTEEPHNPAQRILRGRIDPIALGAAADVEGPATNAARMARRDEREVRAQQRIRDADAMSAPDTAVHVAVDELLEPRAVRARHVTGAKRAALHRRYRYGFSDFQPSAVSDQPLAEA